MPNGSKREWLKERHRFSEWAGRSALPKDGHLEAPAFRGTEVRGFALDRSKRREDRETSFWREGENVVIRIDIFVCPTVDAAHEYLIDALGEFEANIERRAGASFGDVAFGTETVALFARGNLVVVVRNAGRKVIGIDGVAQAVDAILLGGRGA